MKKPILPILIVIALVLAAFAIGFFLGRNATGSDVQISVIREQLPEYSADENSASVLININTADVTELSLLPGIGETYAQRIVDFRSVNGPFDSVEQLLNVEGIGAARFEALLDYVTVGG